MPNLPQLTAKPVILTLKHFFTENLTMRRKINSGPLSIKLYLLLLVVTLHLNSIMHQMNLPAATKRDETASCASSHGI